MACSLALVSKRLYSLMIPLIYTHVRLTKPSDLLLYAQTVSSRPCLSQHTRSLWIGPDEDHVESRNCWPLNEYRTAMISSITDPLELPIRLDAGTCYSFEAGQPLSSEGWLFEAARVVIREASRTVGDPQYGRGVSLRCGGTVSFDGKKLGLNEGQIRVYQVQQVLDCFLQSLRKRQQLRSAPGPALRESSTICSLRTHPASDRFDHPLVYARTGTDSKWPTCDWALLKKAMVDEEEDIKAEVQRSILHTSTEYSGECCVDLEEAICGEVRAAVPSVVALVLLSRVVLAQSPNLVGLALKGYLQQAVTGTKNDQRFERLHLLALGPPGRHPEAHLRLSHAGLASVKKLRLWGKNWIDSVSERPPVAHTVLPFCT
ncbi:hypothetical protein BCV69DRAFT_86690 [Microstroma glucosiphilum]|uniref:Uncharacterized protein n=1 Tax=Pseudomicrostroma glucosiphilum TaxID=1684307 RepID=A0A316TY22_9BASI|nr:hypothetical protein BCV69DRAFT_86690 [Pseudomicrostroma glucosiphilum]PWN18162.1 hypothetical protein BCV69DRAFT_86690 [Pseudomicrostroma glucosiphilum]